MQRGLTVGAGKRAWGTALLLSLGLLIVPVLVWLVLPSPPPVALPPREPLAAAPPAPAPTAVERAETSASPSASPPTTVPASAGPLRGVVLDPEGRPIADAFVACLDGELLSASAGPDGRFELPPEAEGCTAVATQAPHNASEPTRVTAAHDNVLRLTRGGAIAGNVVDEAGNPVAAFLLAIESFVPAGAQTKSSVSGRARQVFDDGGAFLWEDLAPGRYVLTASAAARPPVRSQGVDVESGRTTHHVRIVLPQGATLKGTVVDAGSREPLAGAQVELDGATSSGANAISLVLTDASGGYELEGVPASGPFSVRASHEGHVTKIVPSLDARGARELRADIELRARGEGGSREELSGIGATLAPSAKGVSIVGVIDGGPAQRAGLQQGDRIVRIDGTEAADMTVSDCVQRLRGPVGTRVSVAVERDGQTIEVTLRRDTVVR